MFDNQVKPGVIDISEAAGMQWGPDITRHLVILRAFSCILGMKYLIFFYYTLSFFNGYEIKL
ncbi:MAG: hypothetical protein Ct9H90mP22_2880 [Gammaproteobacteria bacterium]|nr:MAG: hypothetical protein Ct9H90mP22_2880 [Gammaproteobacteria bacterium]